MSFAYTSGNTHSMGNQKGLCKLVVSLLYLVPLSYDETESLKSLHLYTVQHRFERYIVIYIWKILESIVLNLSQPIACYLSDRIGRLCHSKHVCVGRIGTLSYNSFHWKADYLTVCHSM